jgi:hypothetical protein
LPDVTTLTADPELSIGHPYPVARCSSNNFHCDLLSLVIKRKTESKLLSWQICNNDIVALTKVIPICRPVVKLTKIISPQSVPIIAT